MSSQPCEFCGAKDHDGVDYDSAFTDKLLGDIRDLLRCIRQMMANGPTKPVPFVQTDEGMRPWRENMNDLKLEG